MIHKIAYPLLIVVILLFGVFAYIKANEAEKKTILAMESAAQSERLHVIAQESSAKAAEAAAQAQLEAEQQRLEAVRLQKRVNSLEAKLRKLKK